MPPSNFNHALIDGTGKDYFANGNSVTNYLSEMFLKLKKVIVGGDHGDKQISLN